MIRTLVIAFLLASFPLTAVAQTTGKPTPPASGRKSAPANLVLDPPSWLQTFDFPQTNFTFVRIEYDTVGLPGRGSRSWATDYPDADANLIQQLGSLTKLRVSEEPRVMRLTDPAVANHPILYLSEPGRLHLRNEEVTALRKYLDAGGFLFMDDFWGVAEWENARAEMKRVFPDRDPVDLPLSHQLFHCVFDLKEKPQVVTIQSFVRGRKSERDDAPEAHYRAIQDPRGRMSVLMCHNTDLGDGWESVNEYAAYAREMSAAKAFPMGINILFYALTQQKY
jgi:hypothetical protein